MRYFNTTGPCVPERHYLLPPEQRLPEAHRLIDEGKYFVVHAPPQTGKTTTLAALARQLTAEGAYTALHVSCRAAVHGGQNANELLDEIRLSAETLLPAELQPPEYWPDAPSDTRLRAALIAWATVSPRPLVLLFDEVDSLPDDGQRSLLHLLQVGFAFRPQKFPAAVILCSQRDLAGSQPASGPSKLKVDSLRLGGLSESDLHALYAQYTAETGQPFTPEALAQAWRYTQGQPWLVNALAREVVRNMEVPPDEPIRAAHIITASERLVAAGATHLDSLLARLREPPVRRLIEPLIAGEAPAPGTTFDDDVAYARDLGLVAEDLPLRIANPSYEEIIVRTLATLAEAIVTADAQSFVQPDGRLDLDELVQAFAAFWKANAETLTSGDTYQQVAPQLAIMAYFRRIVTGDSNSDSDGRRGFIDRELGVGRGRVDLLIRWPYHDETDKQLLQREAFELKGWHEGRPDPLPDGLSQLDDYLRRHGLDEGTLVIFDRRAEAPPIEERTQLTRVQSPSGRKVTLLRA